MTYQSEWLPGVILKRPSFFGPKYQIIEVKKTRKKKQKWFLKWRPIAFLLSSLEEFERSFAFQTLENKGHQTLSTF